MAEYPKLSDGAKTGHIGAGCGFCFFKATPETAATSWWKGTQLEQAKPRAGKVRAEKIKQTSDAGGG